MGLEDREQRGRMLGWEEQIHGQASLSSKSRTNKGDQGEVLAMSRQRDRGLNWGKSPR